MYEYEWVNFDKGSLNVKAGEGWRVVPGMKDAGFPPSILMEREVPVVVDEQQPFFQPHAVSGAPHPRDDRALYYDESKIPAHLLERARAARQRAEERARKTEANDVRNSDVSRPW